MLGFQKKTLRYIKCMLLLIVDFKLHVIKLSVFAGRCTRVVIQGGSN